MIGLAALLPVLIYLAGIAASILLGVFVPLPWIGPPLADILFAAGLLIIVAVIAIHVSALRGMARAGAVLLKGKAADQLVTTGAFAITRNPMYLANALLLVAGGLVDGNLWFLLAALLATLLVQLLAVKPEEKQLEARFGKRYRDYAKRVRRWI
ncbi:MAG: isoprenylcysteine carboxylmethyltransferase family protein [Rhizobiaceae bacterium]